MTISDVKEIRKRIEPTLGNFKTVYGCYVNAAGEIVSTMAVPVLDMDQEEREQYASLLKKAVSGTIGKNLFDIPFSTEQVADSDEHRLLMGLRASHLEDEGLREALYQRVVDSLDMSGKSYVVLLASDTYDVRSREGGDDDWSEESENQFEYFVCSICQVKEPKAALRYLSEPKAFRGVSTGSLLAAPILGFMFPVFDERASNIYGVLYYSKSAKDIHEELIDGVFNIENAPLSSEMQKIVFGETLAQALAEECSMEVVTGVQAKIAAKIGDNEGDNAVVTPEISLDEVGSVLEAKGVSEAKIAEFKDTAKARMGSDSLSAINLLQKEDYKITSSESKISVDPEQALRIRTRKIDGVTYFLVPVGSDVKVNGIDISVIAEREE